MRKKEIIMGVIMALGVLLRLAGLSSQSVSSGECETAALSTGQNLLFVFFNSLENGSHPPLFYMLEHVMINIFGMSEMTLRLLPALLGVLSIFIFYRLVRSFFSEKVTSIALFLYCLNPFLIYFSREAGPYTLYLTVSMLIVYYFLMSIKYNSFLAGPFILWSIIGIYTHENTVFLLLILNFIIFVTNRKDIRLIPWAIAQGVIFSAFIPLAMLSLKPALAPEVSIVPSLFLMPYFTLKNFLTGPGLPQNWVAAVCVFVCVVFAVLGVISKRKVNEKKVLDAAAIMIIFIMAVQWINSISNPAYQGDKNMLVAAALFILVLSVGISYMSTQGLAAFLVLITAVYSVSLFNSFFSEKYAKIPYRELFKKVETNAIEGSLIIHLSRDSFTAFEFYNESIFKHGYINKLQMEPQEFTGKGSQVSINNVRKNYRENINRIFKFNIENSRNKNLMGEAELKAIIGGYRRAFLITDSITGMKQPYLGQAGLWNSDFKYEPPPGPESLWWVKEYFQVKEKTAIYGCDAYALEKK